MRLTEKDMQAFRHLTSSYLGKERTLSSRQILNLLEKDDPALIKRIAKAGKKIGPLAYIGRCLMPTFKREGWLIYKDNMWVVNIVPERCAQCFKPIGEVYMIDGEKNRFCSTDCCDEFESLDNSYESYYDEYMEVFDSFSEFYHDINYYNSIKDAPEKVSPIEHIRLLSLINKIGDIIYNPDYAPIMNDGGSDGPMAEEIYRMINIFKDAFSELQNIESVVQKSRAVQKITYTIFIDSSYIAGPGKSNKALKSFMKKAQKYLMENGSMWGTTDLKRRNKWYDELSPSLDSSLHYNNLVECPLCSSLVEHKYIRQAIDGYRYCEVCHDTVKIAGGFDEGYCDDYDYYDEDEEDF